MTARDGDVDVAAVLRYIAEHEALEQTQRAFSLTAAELRQRLVDAAATLPTLRSRRRFDPLEETPAQDVGEAAQRPGAGPAARRLVAEAPPAAPKASRPPGIQRSHVVVYSDGASRGNPGPAGAGWVICEPDGRVLAKGGIFLGKRTNNEAEYVAAAMGLKAAQQFGATAVVLRADSELMVRQLEGRYKVKHPRIIPLYEQVRALTKQYRSFRAEHVPRAQNAAADEQANIAIDEARP
ncbi:MAG TPA: ribonuclease HI family protein [Myxococcota bacterium]|nr:ribonuclease HI family protein [Myxococcota bacterium]